MIVIIVMVMARGILSVGFEFDSVEASASSGTFV